MNLSENLRIATRALSANKLRAALTMLGIIIGVGSVVALMALGNGATASITQQVEGIGSNLITVLPFRMGAQSGTQVQQAAVLYYADYEALKLNLKNVAAIAPAFQSNATLTAGDQSRSLSVVGTTPAYAQARAYSLSRGRFLNTADYDARARVAVLGSQTAENFFGQLNAIGRSIKISGVPFKIVGVLEAKGSSGFDNADDVILIPLSTGFEKLFGSRATQGGKLRVSNILISAADAEAVDGVMVQVERVLRRQHNLGLNEDLDFSVLSQASFLSTLSSITTILTTFLGAIAAISLLVGGIGIMNIMLVSVTERTKEIGLRKAVGARRSAILGQFLVETVILSLTGGLLGVGLGLGVSGLVSLSGVITPVVTLNSVVMAFSFAAAVGLVFGLYPAYRASRLSPIDALRYE